MRCFGAYLRISAASLWHREQTAMTCAPVGLPRNPVDGALAAALSVAAGSPPWQSTQLKPRSRWTSVSAKSRAGVASVADGSLAWHVWQPVTAACCASARGTKVASAKARARSARTI